MTLRQDINIYGVDVCAKPLAKDVWKFKSCLD